MHIQIVAVGKLKEVLGAWHRRICQRLGPYVKLTLTEVPDEKAPETMSPAEEMQVREREGERILAQLKPDAHVVALALDGELWSSEDLAGQLDKLATYGRSHVALLLAGATVSLPQ